MQRLTATPCPLVIGVRFRRHGSNSSQENHNRSLDFRVWGRSSHGLQEAGASPHWHPLVLSPALLHSNNCLAFSPLSPSDLHRDNILLGRRYLYRHLFQLRVGLALYDFAKTMAAWGLGGGGSGSAG